jgi:hypothetical protein
MFSCHAVRFQNGLFGRNFALIELDAGERAIHDVRGKHYLPGTTRARILQSLALARPARTTIR